MSITDELREWMYGHTANCSDNRIALVAIADRIDAEHQKALDEWKAEHGQMWLKGYSECHAELLEGNETLASDLDGCGWMRLPVDADDVPIRIGDKMGFIGSYGNVSDPFVVKGFESPDMWLVHYEEGHRIMTNPMHTRHYHELTVEDMLREFAEKVIDSQIPDVHPTYEEAIAEYAAKLRLAGDGE